MAFLQYLVFNNENIPNPVSYARSPEDVLADSSGETEAGTTQRDVVREGVNNIPLTFQVSPIWLKKFAAYKKLPSINVKFLDPITGQLSTTAHQMYIDDYRENRVHDTSYGGLWEVSFTLREF